MDAAQTAEPARAPAPPDAWLTFEQAMAYLNVNERHLRRLVERRQIPVRHAGRLLRFVRSELDAWSLLPPAAGRRYGGVDEVTARRRAQRKPESPSAQRRAAALAI